MNIGNMVYFLDHSIHRPTPQSRKRSSHEMCWSLKSCF